MPRQFVGALPSSFASRQIYQSLFAFVRFFFDSKNHGCWSEVWL